MKNSHWWCIFLYEEIERILEYKRIFFKKFQTRKQSESHPPQGL